MFAYGKSLFLVIDLQWRIGLIAKVGVYAVFCPPSGGWLWLLKTWICAWYWCWCMIT